MRKNIFVFNVNKDDVKNLSEIDLFHQQQIDQDGHINSKNYHLHIDPDQKNGDSVDSSKQSKLLRYSKFSEESSPRKY